MSEEQLLDELPGIQAAIVTAVQRLGDPVKDYAAMIGTEYWSAQDEARSTILAGRNEDQSLGARLSAIVAKLLATECGLSGYVLDGVAYPIARDLELMVIAKRTGVSTEFVAGIWVCYRAGCLPTTVIMTSRQLPEIINISEQDAKDVVSTMTLSSTSQHDADDISSQTAEFAGRMPTSAFLQAMLTSKSSAIDDGLSQPGWSVAVRRSEIQRGADIPEAWIDRLQEQEAGRAIKWTDIWIHEVLAKLPSVQRFLEEFCRGVAILERPETQGGPALLYVYTEEYTPYPCGYRYGCYAGGTPCEVKVDGTITASLAGLPYVLQMFYMRVHDGWSQMRMYDRGLMCLRDVQPLSEHQAMREVVRLAHHRLCLDTRTSHEQIPEAVMWYSDGQESMSGLEFWEAIDAQVELGVRSMLCATV